MKLTKKALQYFCLWLDENNITQILFNSLPEYCQNSLIIEFFDLAGIYILIKRTLFFDDWIFYIIGHYNSNQNYNSRQEATNEAIIKANELLNEC